MSTMLALQGVSKSFGALKVTDDVSFEVSQGQALGIIGPNGAGKSTLFNLITGNLMADTGSVHFQGRDVTRVSAMDRCTGGMGRSFQIPQPFGKLSVYENLLVAAAFGQGRSENAVEDFAAEVLDQTELTPKANAIAGGLSLLDRKRLELAKALATDPKLLLLDEIAGGLTDAECTSLIATIKGINQRGVTIIWIEHVLHALTAVVEQLLVLDFGKVIGIGAPDEVMARQDVKEIYLGAEI
ncbi:MAG: ABC transporter ATP-binding protein [Pseudomonadota bacterium]